MIARLPSGWAVLGDTQPLRGYCLLLGDPVARRLNAMAPATQRGFLADMACLGDAVLATATAAARSSRRARLRMWRRRRGASRSGI